MITKVTIKGMRQAVQMFGPAQAAVAKAVADSVADGVIPKDQGEDLVIVCGVFIHPEAADNKKIYDYNYEATKQAIANAMAGKPTADEMLAGKDAAASVQGLLRRVFWEPATLDPCRKLELCTTIAHRSCKSRRWAFLCR